MISTVQNNLDTAAGAGRIRPVQVGFPCVLTSAWNPTTGYSWKRTYQVGVSVTDPDLQETGQYAVTPDNSTSLAAGTAGWLEIEPGAVGYVFLPSAAGGTPSAANCSGCGWFASLLSTDCLTATVLSATGRCGGSGSGGSGGGSGSGSSPPPPPPGMALYSCDGGVCTPTGTSTGDPLVTCVAGGCDPPGSGSALPFDLSSTGCGVIAVTGGAPTIFRVGNECSGTVPLPSGWATYDGYTLIGTGDYGGAADTIMTVSIDPATGVVTAAYTTGGRTYFATATVECSGGSVSIFWSFDFEFAPCTGSVLFQLDLT